MVNHDAKYAHRSRSGGRQTGGWVRKDRPSRNHLKGLWGDLMRSSRGFYSLVGRRHNRHKSLVRLLYYTRGGRPQKSIQDQLMIMRYLRMPIWALYILQSLSSTLAQVRCSRLYSRLCWRVWRDTDPSYDWSDCQSSGGLPPNHIQSLRMSLSGFEHGSDAFMEIRTWVLRLPTDSQLSSMQSRLLKVLEISLHSPPLWETLRPRNGAATTTLTTTVNAN